MLVLHRVFSAPSDASCTVMFTKIYSPKFFSPRRRQTPTDLTMPKASLPLIYLHEVVRAPLDGRSCPVTPRASGSLARRSRDVCFWLILSHGISVRALRRELGLTLHIRPSPSFYTPGNRLLHFSRSSGGVGHLPQCSRKQRTHFTQTYIHQGQQKTAGTRPRVLCPT